MTRTEARVKKQRAINKNKNTIIFPVEYSPRGTDGNAIINRHQQGVFHNTTLF